MHNYQLLSAKSYGPGSGPTKYYLDACNFVDGVYVIGYQDLITSNSCDFDKILDILQNLYPEKIIFVEVNHATDQFGIMYRTLQEKFGIENLCAITGDTSVVVDKDSNNVIYFPFYWYAFIPGKHQLEIFEPWILHTKTFTQSRPYVLSCLNNRCKLERLLLFDQLFDRSYFSKIKYTFNSVNLDDDYCNNVDPEMIQLLNKHNINLPIRLERRNNFDFLSNIHLGLRDSYLNIVTEHHYSVPFLSEKIFKPITSGQFFFALGGPGLIQTLRYFEFDTFDDILDHSYDLEPDIHTRVSKLVHSVDKFMQLDHDKIWRDTVERRINNAKHFFNLDVATNPFQSFFTKKGFCN